MALNCGGILNLKSQVMNLDSNNATNISINDLNLTVKDRNNHARVCLKSRITHSK